MLLKAIKFTLSGETAHFKIPEVNSINLTYSHIHKVAVLGILGNMIWLGGRRNKSKDQLYPEFYDKLKDLQISIVPRKKVFGKAIKEFTNTTGFANKIDAKQGTTLMVREQILIKPSWDIYIIQNSDNAYFMQIKDFISKTKSYGSLYLGKTHHPAEIDDYGELELAHSEKVNKIDSLFPYNDVRLDDSNSIFVFRQIMPTGLIEKENTYVTETLSLSDSNVLDFDLKNIYSINNLNLYFI
jgi:CRISPR-associated protein Cas5h